jgi:hypothetical protein
MFNYCFLPWEMGDGPLAAGLDPKPADLSERHAQDLFDGALFYVIHNGVEGIAMPAWKDALGEEDMWYTGLERCGLIALERVQAFRFIV